MQATATILAIDDNATIRKAVAMRLVARGFEVVTAADGPSGLALLDARPFDVVLLDLVMPGMRGEEVLKRLRDRHAATELPVIMLAASGETGDIQRSLDLGANDYIVKPGNLATLVVRIQTQIALRDTLARLRAQPGAGAPHPAPVGADRENLPYALLYEHAPGNCFTLTAHGEIRHVSRAAAAALGHAPETLRGQTFDALYRADEQAQVRAQLARLRQHPDHVLHWDMHQLMANGERVRMRHLGRALAIGDDILLLVACENIDEAWKLGRQLALQARHDPLTGLANRATLEHRVQELLDLPPAEDSPGHTLVVLAPDAWKLVNDSCGTAGGDALLRHVARTLKTLARGRDMVARLGGDAFALLIEDCSLAAARNVVEGVHRVLAEQPFAWRGQRFRFAMSSGMALLRTGERSSEDVLTMAEAARHAARQAGRNRIHAYQDDDLPIRRRQGTLRWAARFAQALHDDQFRLVVQPIEALGRPDAGTHCEVLVRMLDEQGQLVLPGEFLPVAERYRLAASLDRWVIEHTLGWLRGRSARGARLPTLCAINLSGQSIGDDDLLGFILEELGGGGIAPERICFEVTETAAIADLSQATWFMHRLKERGCQFALDDFGSGYSSLVYLKHLPVDYLKIDGSFVRDMASDPLDYAMVRSINDIGHVMGKRTVAEFVESPQTLQLLHELSVDYAQGYAIGRPLPLDSFAVDD